MLAVRATINLQGLHAGERALVDEGDPYIAMLLERGILVPVVQPNDGVPSNR